MKKSTIIKYLSMAACAAMIAGVITACGESRTPNSSTAPALSAPENLYISYNQTAEYETEYILTWDKAEDADWYEITVGGKTFTTKKTSYEVTNYCTEGETARMSVKAISEADDFRDSKAANIKEKIEEVTSGIIYNKRTNGGYEAVFASAVEGRLVLPDTYNGQVVKRISKAAKTILHEKLTSVRFPKHLTEIGTDFFYNSKLTEVTLPDGLTTIEDRAFFGVDRLNNIVLPTKLTVIGEDAFGCCGIENLFVPKSVKEMGIWAFADCENLKTVTFEQGGKLKEIAVEAFAGCTDLTEIALPEGLQTIGRSAFHYCTNLAEIELPEALQTIEYEAFQHCERLTTLHLPKGVTNLQGGALCNPAFTAFTVAEDNSAYQAIDGNIYSKDGTQFVQYAIGKTASEFTVPEGVTKIGDYAFCRAENLLRINLPQGLTEIGNGAFVCCAITEIELPYGLTTIGEYAFADREFYSGYDGVSNLTSIVLPDSVTSFGIQAFSTKNLTELILSKNIKVIKTGAFIYSRFPVLELPEGVTLEERAFTAAYIQKVVIPKDLKKCEGDLSLFGGFEVTKTEIFYKGTSEEWEALKRNGVFNENTFTFSLGVFGGEPVRIPLTIYFYSEEEPTEDGNFWRYVDGVPTPWE